MGQFDTVAGHTSLSGTLIPEIWINEIMPKFWKQAIFPQISSTDLVKPLQKGGADIAHIRKYPSFTPRAYVIGQKLEQQTATMDVVDFPVDQGYYINTPVDKVEAVQSDLNLLNIYTTAASNDIKDYVDNQCFDAVVTQAGSNNQGTTAGAVSGSYNLGATGSPIAITASNSLDKLEDLIHALLETDVPQNDIWVCAPLWYGRKLKTSPLAFAGDMGDGKSPVRTGNVGDVNGVTIYFSNNMTTVTDTVTCYYVLAGHRSALGFASQITEVRTKEPSDEYSTLLQMFGVYGVKAINTDYLGMLYCKPVSE